MLSAASRSYSYLICWEKHFSPLLQLNVTGRLTRRGPLAGLSRLCAARGAHIESHRIPAPSTDDEVQRGRSDLPARLVCFVSSERTIRAPSASPGLPGEGLVVVKSNSAGFDVCLDSHDALLSFPIQLAAYYCLHCENISGRTLLSVQRPAKLNWADSVPSELRAKLAGLFISGGTACLSGCPRGLITHHLCSCSRSL
jgi:hypothetical protein